MEFESFSISKHVFMRSLHPYNRHMSIYVDYFLKSLHFSYQCPQPPKKRRKSSFYILAYKVLCLLPAHLCLILSSLHTFSSAQPILAPQCSLKMPRVPFHRGCPCLGQGPLACVHSLLPPFFTVLVKCDLK